MNQTRSFLLIAWLLVATLLWMEWNKGPVPAETATPATSTVPAAPAAPLVAPGAEALPNSLPAPGLSATPAAAAASAEPIVLQNDVLKLTVDLHGGRLIDSQLLAYTLEKKPDSPRVSLLSADPAHYFSATAGLLRADAQQREQLLDETFRTEDGRRSYVLPDGAQALTVPLLWTDPGTGLEVRRTLTLTRGSYVLGLSEQVSNRGSSTQRVYPYNELERVAPPAPAKHSSLTNPESFSFIGAAWYSPQDKFEKTKFDAFAKQAPLNKAVTGGWVAMLQHHFVAAWVPAPGQAQVFSLRSDSRNGVPVYRIRSVSAPLDLAAGTTQTRDSRLWVGPKLQAPLERLAPGLKLTLDYGIFTFIAQPLFDYVLKPLHYLTGNWGWAIILTVVILKLLLYPLSAAQYRSTAKMRAVQPRIEALKERYGQDKQQFQIAMMELYKKEKINPVGGCLPMLIPIPIFFALYWVLLETVELRHAAWMGWVQNLTDADPYFILPALNLLVMYLTQKLTPTPGMDPMQKKMMQFMPLVFGVMMAFFPAGLVLYWVTNGALGLLQQWWVTKQHGTQAVAVAK